MEQIQLQLNMPVENPPYGWYVAVTEFPFGYLNKDGTIHSTTEVSGIGYKYSWQDPGTGYWKTFSDALIAKKEYEDSFAITYGFATREPDHNLQGWFIYIGGVGMHLCTDCVPRKINTAFYNSNIDLFYFDRREEANRVRDLYISYGLSGPEKNAKLIPEPQLVVCELENPVQDNGKWCVYTKDTGYYSYALSKDNTICHTAYRKHWDTENAALFAKLCYERKVKNLKK